MKLVKLSINGSKVLRFELYFKLDRLTIIIRRKLASSEWVRDFFQTHNSITKDTNINELLENAFDEYLMKKDIETYWGESLKDTDIVEISEKKDV